MSRSGNPPRPAGDPPPVSLRQRLEYVAVRAFAAVATLFGERWTYWLARRAGGLLYRLDARHRRIACENLRLRLLDAEGRPPVEREVRRIARASFDHVVAAGLELLLTERAFVRRPYAALIQVEGREHVERAAGRGAGLIFVTAHLGNWEVAGATFRAMGHDLVSVYRPLDNPLLDRWVRSLRGSQGQEPIPKKGAVRGLLKVLRKGGWVVLLVDQDAGSKGLRVPFLGAPASTVTTPAELALRTGAPIVSGFCVRTGPGFRFRMWFEPEVEGGETGDREADVLRITTELNARIGAAVRAHPEQWLWSHRRWKRSRGHDAEHPSMEPPA